MELIRWNEPRFNDEEIQEITKVIKENYVNEGPKTKELEEKIKEYLDIKYAIITTNATAALFLALKADSIIRGVKDFEVIIPDMTMIATATSVNWAGGKPILVDIKKDDLTIDPKKIEEKITPKTTAIILVHILGRSAEISNLKEIAKKHNLTLIEDAAGAFGSKKENKFLGTLGKIGCFSLQSNKIITSGQGGIIVTNDEKYYETIRRLRDFGRLNNKEFLHETIGYNLKFNDLSAALAVAQFKKIEERKLLLLNQLNKYKQELSSIKHIKFFDLEEGEIPLWIDVIVEKRDKLKEFLESNNIFCRNCWPAIHRNKPYQSEGSDLDYPNASYFSDNVIWLPNGPALTDIEIEVVCSKIKEFYKND